eukprot:2903721-Pleurochrysis_carterae.AAC.3
MRLLVKNLRADGPQSAWPAAAPTRNARPVLAGCSRTQRKLACTAHAHAHAHARAHTHAHVSKFACRSSFSASGDDHEHDVTLICLRDHLSVSHVCILLPTRIPTYPPDYAPTQRSAVEPLPNYVTTCRTRPPRAQSSLQSFVAPTPIYSAVWVQWVSIYVSDADLLAFLLRAKAGLAPKGLIVVKVGGNETLQGLVVSHAFWSCSQYFCRLLACSLVNCFRLLAHACYVPLTVPSVSFSFLPNSCCPSARRRPALLSACLSSIQTLSPCVVTHLLMALQCIWLLNHHFVFDRFSAQTAAFLPPANASQLNGLDLLSQN